MIVIPERPLPKCCAECPCVHMEGTCFCQAVIKFNKISAPFSGRAKWCPLIEAKYINVAKMVQRDKDEQEGPHDGNGVSKPSPISEI